MKQFCDEPTNGPTDQWIDQQTNGPTKKWLIESPSMRLKKNQQIFLVLQILELSSIFLQYFQVYLVEID